MTIKFRTKRLYNPEGLQLLGKVAISLVVVWAIWLARQPLMEILSIIKDREAIASFIQGYGVWGPVLFVFIIAAQVVVAIIPGHIVMVAGGYIYGFTGGFMMTFASIVVASQFTFALARSAGRPVVNRLAPKQMIDHWHAAADRQGIMFFIAAFILPIFPSDVMSYVAGLSSISPRRFLIATIIGRIPTAVLMTLIGSHGFRLPPQLLMLIVVASIGGFVAWQWWTRKPEGRYPNK